MMLLLRLAVAMAVTRVAAAVAVALVPELEEVPAPAERRLHHTGTQIERCCHDGNTSRLKPAEWILLGSIVGLAICGLWVWIAARASL